MHDGRDWARQNTLSTQKVLLSKRCKHVHKSFASVTKAGPEYKKINQEIKVSFLELPKSDNPLKLPSNLFWVFYEVRLLKSHSKNNKSLGLRWCWASCSAGLVFNSQKLLFLAVVMWFVHLAGIQWPTGMQSNHYKYIHQPNISSNGMETIHIKFLSGLATTYPVSAELKELNYCH